MEHALQKIDPRILGEKLKNARTDRGLTQNDAADHLGVARTTVVAIEKGDRRITAKELVMLAPLYGRPLSDWLSEKPAPVPLVPQFRMPPRELNLGESEIRDAVSKLESLARDYAGLEERTALPLVRRHPVPYAYEGPGITPEMRGEEVAAEERTRLGLGDGPIHDLRSVLEESVGLRVFYLDLPSVIGGIYAYSEIWAAASPSIVSIPRLAVSGRWPMNSDTFFRPVTRPTSAYGMEPHGEEPPPKNSPIPSPRISSCPAPA